MKVPIPKGTSLLSIVIIGAALIRHTGEAKDPPQAAYDFVHSMMHDA